jgi:predicted acyltransferase
MSGTGKLTAAPSIAAASLRAAAESGEYGPQPPPSTPPTHPPVAAHRVTSIDAFRGLVMFLMLAEAMHLYSLSEAYPDSAFWSFVNFHTTHVEWIGCSLHDLIQPAFSFLVGTAMAFSLAKRQAAGQRTGGMLWHAVVRATILVLLGVFLRSMGSDQTNWTFEDTLTQIGLGYVPLFLLALAPLWLQITAAIALLGAIFAAFGLWPLPAADFDYAAVGVPADWPHLMSGWPAHWNKNSNFAWWFDTWWMNVFPRSEPFTHNGGGYSTLSFIPTLVTMQLGFFAGQILRSHLHRWPKVGYLALLGACCGLTGWALGYWEICPIVKRIWTPSWTLYSGGICCLILAGLYAVCDIWGWRRWSFPLLVIGANSILAYLMSWMFESFTREALVRHLGESPFAIFGPVWQPVLLGAATLLTFWLFLYWLYRQQIYLRI